MFGYSMSMKNSNDTIGNRTRELPACTAVPQPTAPPRTPKGAQNFQKCRNPLETKGATTATLGKFYTEDPQILGATVQNLEATAMWLPGFVHPCWWAYINTTG
jgi:hypothetical protein